jgi:hypothetical protein
MHIDLEDHTAVLGREVNAGQRQAHRLGRGDRQITEPGGQIVGCQDDRTGAAAFVAGRIRIRLDVFNRPQDAPVEDHRPVLVTLPMLVEVAGVARNQPVPPAVETTRSVKLLGCGEVEDVPAAHPDSRSRPDIATQALEGLGRLLRVGLSQVDGLHVRYAVCGEPLHREVLVRGDPPRQGVGSQSGDVVSVQQSLKGLEQPTRGGRDFVDDERRWPHHAIMAGT